MNKNLRYKAVDINSIETDLMREIPRTNVEGETPPVFITLLDEPFKDWIFSFEDIKVGEDNGDGSANVSFNYSVVRVPKETTDEHIENSIPAIQEILGKVLTDIITKYAEEVIAENEEDNLDRNRN